MKKQAFNPYLPSYEYVPDGEPYVFGDRVYVYGSHDRFNGENFCLNDYVCWSAPVDDLGDWRYEGVIWTRTDDPKNADGKLFMNAPDVQLGPDGRYYLYYQLSALTICGVAVCDTPAGRYEFWGYVQHEDGTPYGGKDEPFMFDPGIFRDDDGRNYLYVGFSPEGMMAKLMSLRGNVIEGSYCLELADDMKTVIAGPKLVAPGPAAAKGTPYEGHGFYEASSMRKIGDTYYFVYSSILSHELCYATGKRPDEPFTYGGTLVSIGDIGYHGNTVPDNYTGNTHGGMVKIGDQWYIFYHRQTNKQKCARQGCAEPLTIHEDGSIDQAEITSCGLNGGPLEGTGTYEARIACNLSSESGTFAYVKVHEKDKKGIHPYFTQTGEDRQGNPDQYIANVRAGAVAGFKYFDMASPKKIGVEVSGTGIGSIRVSTEPHGIPFAQIEVRATGEKQVFSAEIKKDLVGKCALYFQYSGIGALNFYSFTIE